MNFVFLRLFFSVTALIAGGLLGAICATVVLVPDHWGTFADRFVSILLIAGTIGSGILSTLAFICGVNVWFVEIDE